MARKIEQIEDYVYKNLLPLWREKPEDFVNIQNAKHFMHYFDGLFQGFEALVETSGLEEEDSVSRFRFYIQNRMITGPRDPGTYLDWKMKDDPKKACFRLVNFFGSYMGNYRDKHRIIKVFKETYSVKEFAGEIVSFLKNNPDITIRHLFLEQGGIYDPEGRYSRIYPYRGYAINCPLNPKQWAEKGFIRHTVKTLKKIGLQHIVDQSEDEL